MSTTPAPQIEGLPPGAILKPIQQPDIQGLPEGAILKPIGEAAPAPSQYEQDIQRAKSRNYGQTSMSAGTKTFEQTHPEYVKQYGPQGGAKRFAAGAGIPTSQSEMTQAVQGMLTPEADPAETDKLLRLEEQIPIVGGDFRARADLVKKGDNANAAIPFFGPANAAFAEKAKQGDYAGAAGSALNAFLSLEGLRSSAKPRPAPDTSPSLGQLTSDASARTPIAQPQAPMAAKAASKILGGGEKAMAKKPLPGATAAGNASNAEVRNYAASKGIDLLPGQATQAKGLQTLQAVGERTIVSPGVLPDVLEKQKASFGTLVDDFKTRVGTEAIPDTEAAGTSLKSQAQHGLDNLKQSAQADYQAFQQQAGDIPVDLSDVKAKASASLASQAEALKNVPAQYANPVRNVLKKLSDLQAGPEADPATLKSFNDAVESYGLNPQQQTALRAKLGLPDEAGSAAVKMSTAQQLRSAYLDISRDYTGNVPKSVQRYAAQAAKDIDAAMAKAADSVGATDQWRQANGKWKQLQQTFNNPEHPLYKVLQESDPSKVPTRLLGKGSYGGSPQTVRQLQEAGIDLSPLKREVAQQIADKNFALTNGGRGLSGYSTEFLKTLYSPEEFNELTTMGRVGRAIKFEMNPSGTSNVMEGHRQIHGIIHRTAGAVVGPIASRITTSKALARATMGDVAQPRGLLDTIGSRGPEPPPEPASGAPVTPPQAPKGNAPVTEERGIKPPQKRTFERVSDKDVKDFFSYRFDQLRSELKAAQESGDQAAVADVQRRMGELDQIQRSPRSLQDVLAGKPPQAAKAASAGASRSLSDILSGKPQEKIDLNAPKSKRVIPPDTTAKADYSGHTVPAKAPTFFSKAERVAEEKLPNSMKADQVIPTLQNAGVKAEEMKWLGLDDFLKGKDRVSKADLLEHIQQNNVQVTEAMKGGAAQSRVETANRRVLQLARKEHIGQPDDWALSAAQGDLTPTQIELSSPEMRDAVKELRSAFLDRKASGDRATKFSQYQLPGGENYRELLMTLPDAGKSVARSSWEAYKQELFNKYGTQSQIELSNKATPQEMSKLQSFGDKMEASGKQFNSSHFDEPNVLAHVRFNDRIAPDGSKTLFMEELQSDWHQKGRKEGYQVTPERRTRMDARRQQIESLGKEASPEQRQEWADIMNELHRSPNKVPDAPFKSTWHELAMKRMLRYAAENGYDRVAWTTGEQQAARYDLSKQVNAVQWEPKTERLKVELPSGDMQYVGPDKVPASELEKYVGKDVAAKLAAPGSVKEKVNGMEIHEVRGDDLKVGGEGMKGFYDKILPDFMNKYGKKWGAKVEQGSIGDQIAIVDKNGKEVWSGSRKTMPALDSGDKVIDDNKVHSIPITPAMRNEVIFKGQPISKKQEPRSLMNILSGVPA